MGASFLLRMIGVARGDKSNGNFLMSYSLAFLKSWSNGLASSLKSPTSSQFFKKRVGVGVWSAMMALSFLAGPNFRVISCLCLWTAKWSSFVNLFVRSEQKEQSNRISVEKVQNVRLPFSNYIGGLRGCLLSISKIKASELPRISVPGG